MTIRALVLTLFLLLALFAWVHAAEAGIRWFTGFEAACTVGGFPLESTGTFQTGGGCGGLTVHSGNVGYFSGTLAFLELIGPSTGLSIADAYVRFYFNTNVLPNVTALVLFLNNAGGAANVGVLRLTPAGNLDWSTTSAGAAIATGPTTVTTGTWHQILVHMKVAGSNTGGMEVILDGNTEFTSFGTTTNGGGNIERLGIGPFYNSLSTLNYDDMMLRDDQYPADGVSLARQGTSGSPTYTAWTKNSCTSSLIENCWSQTPFDPTPNASTATNGNAQTMLVHDFATTQTGHGTETINATGTINACKTAAEAKTSSAGNITLRRRISGVDTDTTAAYGTGDGYKDDGIWTTTPAVLRGSTMEIGAVNTTGSTNTVEDMWLICDVLVGGPSAPKHKVTFQ